MRGAPAPAACWRLNSILSIVGLGLTTYLSAVYLSNHAPACGPLSGCKQVTTSEYAVLAGVPVAFLGMATYSTLLLGNLWAVAAGEPPRALRYGLLLLAAAAAAASVYLTVIELFVIRAVCVYCLASAGFVGVILVLSLAAATAGRVRADSRPGEEVPA